jgi:hypothetical protein
MRTLALMLLLSLRPALAGAQELTLELKDYVTMPMTGVPRANSNEVLLAESTRCEEVGASRFLCRT